MFAAILLSQFSPYPGIIISANDVITGTLDAIIETDDVVNTIYTDLEWVGGRELML